MARSSYPIRDDLPGGLHGYGWNPKTGRFDVSHIIRHLDDGESDPTRLADSAIISVLW